MKKKIVKIQPGPKVMGSILEPYLLSNVFLMITVRDHPYITSAKGLGEWVQKIAIFADVHYCIYADILGGWVRKRTKIC